MPSGTICLEHTCICICKIASKTHGTTLDAALITTATYRKCLTTKLAFVFGDLGWKKHESTKWKNKGWKKQTNKQTSGCQTEMPVALKLASRFLRPLRIDPPMHGAQRFHNPNGTQCRHPLAAGLVLIVCAKEERFFYCSLGWWFLWFRWSQQICVIQSSVYPWA